MLDIGGAIGALVLRAAPEAVGQEIEISPLEEPDRRQHVAVHPREIGGDVIHAAVFPSLRWGCYQLWAPDGAATMRVSVAGGRVTEAVWPG